MSAGVCLIIILACLLTQAFFAGSEMAVISSNRLRIRHQSDVGNKRARIIQRFLETPETFLAITLVGINVVMILGSTVASYLTSHILGLEDRGPFVATLVLVPLILIFAETVPKSLARSRATQTSIELAPFLRLASYLLYPLVRLLSWLSTGLVRLLGVKTGTTKMFGSVEDILFLMQEAQQQGALTEDERNMIFRVLDFGDRLLEDIVVPLAQVTSASEDCLVRDIWELIRKTGYSRIPIYRRQVDDIVGTVKVSALVAARPEDSIRSFIRPPYRVREDKRLEEVLEELRDKNVHLAVVQDASEKVKGIVTLEDVMEEIVGDIHDEFDADELATFRRIAEVAEVSGRMRLEELNEILGLKLPTDKNETIAGLLIDLAGRIPLVGDKINHAGHQFTVTQATNRQVVRVEIRGPAVSTKISEADRREEGEETPDKPLLA